MFVFKLICLDMLVFILMCICMYFLFFVLYLHLFMSALRLCGDVSKLQGVARTPSTPMSNIPCQDLPFDDDFAVKSVEQTFTCNILL